MKNIIKWILIIFVIGIIGSAMGGNETKNTSSNTQKKLVKPKKKHGK